MPKSGWENDTEMTWSRLIYPFMDIVWSSPVTQILWWENPNKLSQQKMKTTMLKKSYFLKFIFPNTYVYNKKILL